jgi:hypothetical protein
MLLGLVREGEGVAAQVLVSLGVDLHRVRQQVIQLLAGYEGTAAPGASTYPPPRGGERRGRLVVCSFCGRQPPESGPLVSGHDAIICGRCIRQWYQHLDQSGSEPFPPPVVVRRHGVRRVGPPPADPDSARAGIASAFSAHGTSSQDGRSVPTVERGDNLGPVLAEAKERHRDTVPETADVAVSVDEIEFIDPSHAAVWFTISVDGRALLGSDLGDAVLVDGEWKMARSTFCGLMARAGVACPPEVD